MGVARDIVRALAPKSLLEAHRRKLEQAEAARLGVTLRLSDLFYDLEKGGRLVRIRRAHKIYLPHIAENFDFYFSSVVPALEDGMPMVDMSGPRYHRLIGFDAMPFLFPSHTEPYEATEEYLAFADFKPGQVVLDIGAYSGVTSISFALRVGPTGKVFAFEADAVNWQCATENLRLARQWMGVENIELTHRAVWSHNDGIRFSNELAMGSSAVEITGGGRGNETVVPSTTLESFCAEKGLTRVDVIKMDIEGAELEVLTQSAEWLRTQRAKIIVEPHMVGGVMCTEACVHILRGAGYDVSLREQAGIFPPLILATPMAG